MASKRDRTAGHSERSLSQAFNKEACAFHFVRQEPEVEYLDGDLAVHTRTYDADDAAPNVGAPAAATIMGLAQINAQVTFHVELPAGGSGDIEVWVLTPIVGPAEVWNLIAVYPAVVEYQEYTTDTRLRPVFFRLVNSVGVGVGTEATLRASGS